MEQEQIYMDDNVTVLRQMYAKFPLNKNKNDAVGYLKLTALTRDLRFKLKVPETLSRRFFSKKKKK